MKNSSSQTNYFLAKSEPGVYSIDDLRRDRKTTWDGVTNAQALQVIRQMLPEDRVFIYHSGGKPAVAGLAKVGKAPQPDPANEKLVIVEFAYLAHFEPLATLAEIKASDLFEDWALVRQGRLSTMKAPDRFVEWMRARYPDVSI